MKQTQRIVVLAGAALLALSGCKTNKEAFNAAYERAKAQQEVKAEAETEPAVQEVPQVVENAAPVKEASEVITIVGDRAVEGRYGVVVGSFINRTNANNLLALMQEEGYQNAVIGMNAKDMYRVIVAFYPEKGQARTKVKELRQKFPDAWILIKE